MKNINDFFIIGRQVRDITDNEFKYVNNGTPLLNLCVAVNGSRKVGDTWQDEANFFDVTVWGKTAENLSRFINKGKLLAIRGHLQQQRWEDADGGKRSKVALIADEVELLSKDDTQRDNGGGYVSAPNGNGYAPNNNGGYAPNNNGYAAPNNNARPAPVEQMRREFKGQIVQGGTVDPNEPPF